MTTFEEWKHARDHKPESDFRFPVSDDLFRQHNFYELYPLDGGGAMTAHLLVGTIEDHEFARRILQGALHEWGELPELDFAKLERWRTAEKSCWVTPFYFAPPVARHCWLAGDETAARTLIETILHFVRNYPPPDGKEAIGEHIRYVYHIRDTQYNVRTYEENFADETDIKYIWFDVELSDRLLYLLYALHFLAHTKSLSIAEAGEIQRSLYTHAQVIWTGERFFVPPRQGNHQMSRNSTLLLAAAWFKGFGQWQDFADQAVERINFHIRNDYMPDGSLYENSPSYHCFETRHLRDAVFVAKRYGFPLCQDAEERLAKAVGYMSSLRQPDGHTPVINDGFPVNLEPFLKTFDGVVRAAADKGPAAFFPDAGHACYRDATRYVFLDSSPYTGQFSHYHAGKNAVTFWYDGAPFLVDSGCCSYEDPLFSKWYKRADAHSSLLVGGQGDGTIVGVYNWRDHANIRCAGWRCDAGVWSVASTLTSDAPAWEGVEWTRTLRILPDGPVAMVDEVAAPASRELCFMLNCHPRVQARREGDGFVLACGGRRVPVRIRAASPVRPSLQVERGRCFVDFEHQPNQRLLVLIRHKGCVRLETQFLCGVPDGR